MAKTLVEAYSEYISKQANDLKYAGQPMVEETSDDSHDHWKKNVQPIYHKKGLSPEFASAVEAHVTKHGPYQVSNFHSPANRAYPHWWDSEKGKVKKLKQTYVVDED